MLQQQQASILRIAGSGSDIANAIAHHAHVLNQSSSSFAAQIEGISNNWGNLAITAGETVTGVVRPVANAISAAANTTVLRLEQAATTMTQLPQIANDTTAKIVEVFSRSPSRVAENSMPPDSTSRAPSVIVLQPAAPAAPSSDDATVQRQQPSCTVEEPSSPSRMISRAPSVIALPAPAAPAADAGERAFVQRPDKPSRPRTPEASSPTASASRHRTEANHSPDPTPPPGAVPSTDPTTSVASNNSTQNDPSESFTRNRRILDKL